MFIAVVIDTESSKLVSMDRCASEDALRERIVTLRAGLEDGHVLLSQPGEDQLALGLRQQQQDLAHEMRMQVLLRGLLPGQLPAAVRL